jgi:hypothetical protein
MSHTLVEDDELLREALKCARGRYQRNIILGTESTSGSTLKGKARDWANKYKQSRESLLHRLRTAGILVALDRGGTLTLRRMTDLHYIERAEMLMSTGERPAWDQAPPPR